MSWFRRRVAYPEPDRTAIPLTPGEAGTLVELMRHAARFNTLGNPDVRNGQADVLLRSAGVALATKEPFVPLLVQNVPDFIQVRSDLQGFVLDQGVLTRFELHLAWLQVLVGMAQVHGWTARAVYQTSRSYDWYVRWDNGPTTEQVQAIEAARLAPGEQP